MALGSFSSFVLSLIASMLFTCFFMREILCLNINFMHNILHVGTD